MMERGKEDIISQLKAALDKQVEIAEFWREQAMLLLDRDVENAIYGKSRREILEVRDLGVEN
jgi:hypothetical protein